VSFGQSGQLHLESGEIIGPELSAQRLDWMRLRSEGEVRVSPTGSVFSARTRIEGRRVFLKATFAGEVLASIELVLLDGSGGGGYADQDKLKVEHDRWLAHLGVTVVVSLIDPRNGGASIVVRYSPD